MLTCSLAALLWYMVYCFFKYGCRLSRSQSRARAVMSSSEAESMALSNKENKAIKRREHARASAELSVPD